MTLRCAGAVLILVAAVACSPKAAQPAIPAVVLPDLSTSAADVQAKIRSQYDALQRKQADRTATPGDLAAAHGELGKLLFAAEYLDAAEAAFTNARALAPQDMRWPYYLAHVARFKHDPARAAALFRAALALRSNDVPSLVWIGEMELTQGHADAAAAVFEQALALGPRDAAVQYGLGRVALARRDYSSAVEHLEAAAQLAPAASRVHYPLALAYQGLGDRVHADAELKRRGEGDVSPADPLMAELGSLLDNAPAHERRGAAALEQQQWTVAVAELRQAVALAPDHPYARLNLGTALYMTGDTSGAIEQFQAATKLSPALANAHYSLGIALAARGRDAEAVDELRAAVQADEKFVQARLDLANALRRAERPAESLPHYAAVLEARPDDGAARFGYAMALVRLRRYREARDWLAAAARHDTPQQGFTHALARLLAAAPDPAVRQGAQALALMNQIGNGNRSATVAETMAMALAEVGRFAEAVQLQEQLVASATNAGQPAIAKRLQQNLARYRRGEPCRTPWADDDAVFYPRPADTPPAAPASER